MSNSPKAKAGIEKITLYTPGTAPKAGQELRKLSSNENLYGPSPKAIEAVREASANMWKYPSADHSELREAIAHVHGLDANRVICGNGSDELLALIAQAYAGIGDEVIMTEHGFEIYGIVTHGVGADLVVVHEENRVVDVDAILNAVNEKTRIVYIANPANPTGTMLDALELKRLASSLPRFVVLVVDSAYAEFADGYDGGAGLVDHHDNVIMTRTFSKLYGLGGLRIGWAYAACEMIDNLNRIRGPFNISAPALFGATAAMNDQPYAKQCRETIVKDRNYLRDALMQFGLKADESHANFLLVQFANKNQANDARNFLADHGFLVRSVAHYGLPNYLRVTIGTTEDNQTLAKLFGEFMERV